MSVYTQGWYLKSRLRHKDVVGSFSIFFPSFFTPMHKLKPWNRLTSDSLLGFVDHLRLRNAVRMQIFLGTRIYFLWRRGRPFRHDLSGPLESITFFLFLLCTLSISFSERASPNSSKKYANISLRILFRIGKIII